MHSLHPAPDEQAAITQAGQRAEQRVLTALSQLPAPWQFFHAVEWRTLNARGESVGEADVVVFHPHLGAVVIEVKAGAVSIRNGDWHYASGLIMKWSPFEQARRNRYALEAKLAQRLGAVDAGRLLVTHAVWLPEVVWQGPLPGTEPPSRAFLLDRTSLAAPEAALLKLLREACTSPTPWTRAHQSALKVLLAPDCQQLVPLAVDIEDAVGQLCQATEQQMQALRLLRTQPRLLVEGGAGTGKTVLACALAREHATQGKRVLLTCFNKTLAQHLALCLADAPGVQVLAFHELARALATDAGLPYHVPSDAADWGVFFREQSPELLLQAAEQLWPRFDTLVVDEAADFAPTWWVALEALGAAQFSWYCFYDLRQTLFLAEQTWVPPFSAAPLVLDANLRNTRPIGELALKLAGRSEVAMYRVNDGLAPRVQASADFATMADQLKALLRELLGAQAIKPEQVVVLSLYKHTNAASRWAQGLQDVAVSTDMAQPTTGKVRVGTVQSFKGMEADVVILVGLDPHALTHPEVLYVGASRARAALYVLALRGVVDEA
jgi:hypothetical protein